jgi:F0F1-type ATP synthase alpha subunit
MANRRVLVKRRKAVRNIRKITRTMQLIATARFQAAFNRAVATKPYTELDPATQRQLDRGQRMVELLKQPQYRPYHVNEQVISIFAGANGFLDDLPVSEVLRFEAALLDHVRNEHPEIYEELDRTRDLSKELMEKIRGVIRDFKTHARAAA